MLHNRYKFSIYCVRGNHEARPQDVPDMELIYDENVCGEVYYQPKWPRIRYFKDWGIYTLNSHKVIVIGGAYSVDKYYRLKENHRWFENEQLSTEEMIQCTKELTNTNVDFVFTHTCPYPWRPTDLFLPSVDQSTVDNSMEFFLEEIAKCFNWKIWCFGHYHADRIERPRVEMYFKDTEKLEVIWDRWENQDVAKSWWLVKSPNYYKGLEL